MASLIWPPHSRITTISANNFKIKSCLEYDHTFIGACVATASSLKLLPPKTIDLPQPFTLASYTQVRVVEAITFVIMDNGMVHCLSHPDARHMIAVEKDVPAVMSLSDLLDRVGRPQGTAKLVAAFQTKVADLTWAIVAHERWRVTQTDIYGQFPAYGTYLALVGLLAAPSGLKVRVTVNEMGLPRCLGGTEVESTLEAIRVSGPWEPKVHGTVTYKWGSETVSTLISFENMVELESQGVRPIWPIRS